MKKPTGPAKIEILRATSEAAIGALLFNFDFDDAAVKPEHQAWLNEHAVPSLKATNQHVFLRGIASQKGIGNTTSICLNVASRQSATF